MAGGSYPKLPKELDYPRKGLINNQNIDDTECFEWSLVKCLHLTGYNLRRIIKVDKTFAKRLDFKDIKYPIKTRNIKKIQEKEFYLR